MARGNGGVAPSRGAPKDSLIPTRRKTSSGPGLPRVQPRDSPTLLAIWSVDQLSSVDRGANFLNGMDSADCHFLRCDAVLDILHCRVEEPVLAGVIDQIWGALRFPAH
jgi:hypothetical protein